MAHVDAIYLELGVRERLDSIDDLLDRYWTKSLISASTLEVSPR